MPTRLAWVLVMVSLVIAGCGPSGERGPKQVRAELSGDSPLVAHFRAAEQASGVPAELLATIAYAQTRLSMNLGARDDEHDSDHDHAPREWGLMAIGAGGLSTPDAAALLSGTTVERVKTEARANILAAAALIRTSGHARGVGGGDDLVAWSSVVEAYGGETLVREVRSLLASGWKGHDDQGFEVVVGGVGLEADVGSVQQGLGFPGAIWSPAYSGNYTNASRGAAQINYVVIHTTQGSYAGAISWFKNSSSNVSSHYVIRSSDGQVTQMVDDADIAWHDGCFNTNSIGIEHEGYVADPGKWYTEAMYKSSAKLTRWLCDQYGVPKDRKHVMGHGETPDCSDHTDPGSGWNWTHYMDLVVNGECTPKTEVCNGKDDDCDGKADEGDVCNKPPKGHLDEVSCDAVRGWAQDPDAATKAVDVHVYFGGPAGSGAPGVPLTANLKRDDLCTAIGSCNHAFDILPPLSLLDGKPHAVHAYGIDSAGGDNAQLAGSPMSLTCTATVPKGVRRHVVDPASLEAWKLDLFWDALPLSDSQIASLDEADAWPAAPQLVQADDGSPEVWLVDGKWRRHVPSPEVMATWSLSFDAVKKVPASDVTALYEGPKLPPRPVLVKSSAGKVEMIDDAMPSPGSAAAMPTPGEQGWGGSAGVAAKPGGSAGSGPEHDSNADELGASCSAHPRPLPGVPAWVFAVVLGLPLVRRRSC